MRTHITTMLQTHSVIIKCNTAPLHLQNLQHLLTKQAANYKYMTPVNITAEKTEKWLSPSVVSPHYHNYLQSSTRLSPSSSNMVFAKLVLGW